MTAGAVVCQPDSIAIRRIAYCPTCKRRRRFSGRDALWYGVLWTCLGCGDSWGDGERAERPFRRGWRQDAKRRAREIWQRAVRCGGPEHKAWFAAQMEAEEAFMAQYEEEISR